MDLVPAFRALCESRALRWKLGDIPAEHGGDGWIGYAVDPLQEWAQARGLVRLIGQDAVQTIIGEAFAAVRGPNEPKPWPQKGVDPDAE